jgi:hypothetical protein
MKTTVQQTPPFTPRAENPVSRPPPNNRTQSKTYQPCTTKEPNSSSCVLFRRRQFEFKLGYHNRVSHVRLPMKISLDAIEITISNGFYLPKFIKSNT